MHDEENLLCFVVEVSAVVPFELQVGRGLIGQGSTRARRAEEESGLLQRKNLVDGCRAKTRWPRGGEVWMRIVQAMTDMGWEANPLINLPTRHCLGEAQGGSNSPKEAFQLASR